MVDWKTAMPNVLARLAIDATEDLKLPFKPWHWDKAIRGSFDKCAIALCVKDNYTSANCDGVRVTRNFAYLIYDNGERIVRYTCKGSLRSALIALDKDGLRLEPADLVEYLYPPRGVRTLEYLRSDKFKEIRKRSQEKNKDKKHRFTYRRPDAFTLEGVRHGARRQLQEGRGSNARKQG